MMTFGKSLVKLAKSLVKLCALVKNCGLDFFESKVITREKEFSRGRFEEFGAVLEFLGTFSMKSVEYGMCEQENEEQKMKNKGLWKGICGAGKCGPWPTVILAAAKHGVYSQGYTVRGIPRALARGPSY